MAKHQIAVVVLDEVYSSYDDYSTVIRSITDWSEVDEDELRLFREYTWNKYTENGKLCLIERLDLKDDYISLTLDQIRQDIEKEQEKKAEAQRKREETKRKKELAKLAADEAAEKELLKQLQEKYKELE